MDITVAVEFIIDLIQVFLNHVLGRVVFSLGSYEMSYLDVIFVFFVLGFVTSIFWKGAHK